MAKRRKKLLKRKLRKKLRKKLEEEEDSLVFFLTDNASHGVCVGSVFFILRCFFSIDVSSISSSF